MDTNTPELTLSADIRALMIEDLLQVDRESLREGYADELEYTEETLAKLNDSDLFYEYRSQFTPW